MQVAEFNILEKTYIVERFNHLSKLMRENIDEDFNRS